MLTTTAALVASKRTTRVFLTLTFIALVVAVVYARSLWYVNDDCFVSFRYAKNFVNGFGLVFNAGERVEGYTNFLWTMIIALGMKFGLDPVSFSTMLGIAFFALTVLLYGYLSWRFFSIDDGRQLVLIPLTSLALCLHRDFAAYATSGMETMMFTFLVSWSFAALLIGRTLKSLAGAGLLMVLAMMTRPDGIIFLVAASSYVLLIKKEAMKRVVVFLVPSIVVFLPYWLWRWHYYGFFFPNTFYAKSIGLPYWSQGLVYTWLYFETYYVFIALPILAGAGLWLYLRKWKQPWSFRSIWQVLRQESERPRPLLLSALFIIAYTFFIVRIGGDFMFARFFVPITPMMFFAIEFLLNRLTTRIPHLAITLVILIATVFRLDQFGKNTVVGYIADESRYYTRDHLESSKTLGELFHIYFAGIPVRIAFWAGQLGVVYYADPPFAIETSAGLTDTVIAHQTILERGRPGHEKKPTLDYLVKRKVHFYIGPMEAPPEGQAALNAIEFYPVLARIITYDNSIMEKLALNPDVKFVRLPEYLDAYIAQMKSYPRERVEQDYVFLKSFYFDHNNDEQHEEAFRSYLTGGRSSPPVEGTSSRQ